MKHYIITVPGWGTIHGTGTLRQAQKVAELRAKPSRGNPSVTEVSEPDPRIEWRDLTDLLSELMDLE